MMIDDDGDDNVDDDDVNKTMTHFEKFIFHSTSNS